jgi:hypothetical protein
MARAQESTRSGWRWYEVVLLLFPAVAVALAAIEAGDPEGPRGAAAWAWATGGLTAGAALGWIGGHRSSLAPRGKEERIQGAKAGAATGASIGLFGGAFAGTLGLVVVCLVGGYFLTWVPVRAWRAHQLTRPA